MERRIYSAAAAFALLLGMANPALAYEALENGKLRFGTGSEASVNANGNLQQPFYFDSGLNQWFKLTFSNFPLDNAIGIDGVGTNEWNINGTVVQNSALTGQVLDVSGFTVTSGSKGYGVIISTGTVTIAGKTLELKNTYTLGADKSFIKIVTRLTNTSGSSIGNVRLWVGTRDDWVGTSDQPTKQKGNLVDGAFVAIAAQADRSAALRITTGDTGVLFYSTSPKANTAINNCCSFSNAYNQNPATSLIQRTNDGSYALFVRMADLENGAHEEFTWYYAAGEIENLNDIVDDVVQASDITVTAAAGAGGSITPASAQVPSGSTAAFTVTPAAGHSIADVQGCGGALAGNTYTTGAITLVCTVSASFSLNQYMVSTSAGTGGTIGPGNAQVNHGSTTAFTISPATGFSIATVQGCGGTLSGNIYTTTAITGACAVAASFTLNQYSVNASVGVGGTIGPNGATVSHGSTTSFMVTPAIGYGIASVTGCGGTLNGTDYTTAAITGACTVTASFLLNTYTVSASAGEGGNVSPANATVNHGGTTSFTLTADAGYRVLSVAGCGGSLSGNTYTAGVVTADCAITATFTAIVPVFDPVVPAAREMNATALLTDLPQDIAPRAVDFNGAELIVTLVGGQTRYGPGEYVLTWRAVDARGIEATVQQILRLWPTVSLGPDVSLGFQQDNSASFRIVLNGPAPQVPFTVSYTVAGHTAGHDLESGSAQFAAGETEKAVFFAVTETPPVGTPSQDVEVELNDDVNRGARHHLTIHLLAANAAPVVMLISRQDGNVVPVVDRGGGPVAIFTDIRDPNSADTHSVAWISPPGAAVTVENGTLILQPGSLPAGIHRFEAVVTDSGSPALSTRGVLELVLAETATPLPAGADTWADNGLPEHEEYNPPLRNVLPEREHDLTQFLIEGDPGLHLSLGAQALQEQRLQAELPANSIGPDTVSNVGGYFDFTVRDLPAVGHSVNIVIPQRARIPANPVYRKYDLAAQRWNTFVENSNNALASAPGAEGLCPPPGSDAFRPGLNPGDWCVRLTLSDGGPNDGDGQENGVVVDPGGVGTLSTVVVTTSGKGGGGGAFDPMLLLLAGVLLLFRRDVRRHGRLILLAASVAGSAAVSAHESWYGGLQLGPARGDVSESDVNTRLANAGYDATATFTDLNRNAWRVYAGYQLTPRVGIEAAYLDLGEVRTRLAGNVADIEEFLASANELHPHSARGFELSLHGRYPLTRRIAIGGRGGLLRWNSRYRAANEGGEFERLKDDATDVFFGAGMEFAVHRQWSLSIDWTNYRINGESIGFTGFGIRYRLN